VTRLDRDRRRRISVEDAVVDRPGGEDLRFVGESQPSFGRGGSVTIFMFDAGIISLSAFSVYSVSSVFSDDQHARSRASSGCARIVDVAAKRLMAGRAGGP
jgi:hypothetical protein